MAPRVRTGISRHLISLAVVVANVAGAAIVVLLLLLVLPVPDEADEDPGVVGSVAVIGGYIAIAVVFGWVRGLRISRPVLEFLAADREPTERDRKRVLRLPLRLFWLQALLWTGGILVFAGLAIPVSGLLAIEIAITVALGGLATSAIAYLLTHRLLRNAFAVVLSHEPPRRKEVPGVATRALLTWTLGTAVPIAGALVLSIFAFGVDDVSKDDLALSVLVLTSVALWAGLIATFVYARSLSDPLKRLRDAFAKVEKGSLDVEVPIYDATEIGYAAAGFNTMVAGLREREKLRDLFGRQVGEDVARQALEEGVTLGGEEREAAALFVDLIGSTSFASGRPPGEVVDALNSFFEVVVDVTQEHGGLVNKFEGDAALCVFGAPLSSDDPAGSALAAARAMCDRLSDGELGAGIGVSAGTVVAGNVGTAERYEYTVIGDPVNEAARLTELAKEYERKLLASGAALERADSGEAERWEQCGEETLRGRSEPTVLAVPR